MLKKCTRCLNNNERLLLARNIHKKFKAYTYFSATMQINWACAVFSNILRLHLSYWWCFSHSCRIERFLETLCWVLHFSVVSMHQGYLLNSERKLVPQGAARNCPAMSLPIQHRTILSISRQRSASSKKESNLSINFGDWKIRYVWHADTCSSTMWFVICTMRHISGQFKPRNSLMNGRRHVTLLQFWSLLQTLRSKTAWNLI